MGESVIVGGALIVTVYCPLPVKPCASVAVTVKVNVPTVVGVPESVPLLASVSPGGGVPAVTAKEALQEETARFDALLETVGGGA